jgi:hypothetical protein
MEIWLVIAVIVGVAIIFSVIRAQQLKEAKNSISDSSNQTHIKSCR